MERPEFDKIKSYEEFSRYYWYREELIKICKSKGLKADSGKIELNRVIEAYFKGERILPVKRKKNSDIDRNIKLTKESGLIECGFTFGNRFREFFKKETLPVNASTINIVPIKVTTPISEASIAIIILLLIAYLTNLRMTSLHKTILFCPNNSCICLFFCSAVFVLFKFKILTSNCPLISLILFFYI